MAAQRRSSEAESAAASRSAPGHDDEDNKSGKRQFVAGSGRWRYAALALLVIGALSLFVNAGLLRQREASFGGYAAPPDRNRLFRPAIEQAGAVGTLAVPSGQVVSVSDSLTQLGGDASEATWPLFWVMTAPQNEQTRCQEIINSWGKLVPPDSLVFIGSAENWTTRTGYKFVALPAPPEMKALKEFLSWQYVARAYPDREWYVKGDDDTYFIVNNMNRYLEEYDPRLPYYLGCKFHLGGPGGVQYVSGGAGYVLSKVSTQRLAGATDRCLRYYGRVGEGDIAIAECLQTVGVVPEDTRDETGRQRFHAFPLDYHMNWYRYGFHVSRFWYHDWVWGPEIQGSFCCDDNTTVSFHYMSDRMLKFQWPAAKLAAPIGLMGGPGLGTAPTLSPPDEKPPGGQFLGPQARAASPFGSTGDQPGWLIGSPADGAGLDAGR